MGNFCSEHPGSLSGKSPVVSKWISQSFGKKCLFILEEKNWNDQTFSDLCWHLCFVLFCFVFPFLSPLHLVFFVLLFQISQCLKDLKLTSPISFQDKDYLNNFCFLFNCANNGNIISSLSPCHFKHLLEISSEYLSSFHAFFFFFFFTA